MNSFSYKYEQLIRQSPRIWQPGFIIHNIIHKELLMFAKLINKETDGAVLDFGSGKSPFREIFKSYAGADIDTKDKEPDYLINTESNQIIGVDNDTVSNIISIEVIEHLPNIEAYIKEAYRVLKPGGYLLIVAPFMYNFHGSDDYARYTKNFFTLDRIFHGFKIKRINFELNDFILFIFYQISHFFEVFPVIRFLYPIFFVLNILAFILSKSVFLLFKTLGVFSPKFTELYKNTFLLYPLQISVILRKNIP
ncbi:MAG: methyltransferase domain-containing protein [Candidatus Moranbacteria bacterium]|nr:methyltransferase domain-containing protein [Candidatus Moranbacteria bacterium]